MPDLSLGVDQLQQERIRRGTHTFGPGPDGKNIYRPAIYQHQEYPKVMDRTPAPKISDFKGKPDATVLLEQAMKDWDAQQAASVVHSKAEEEKWLAAHEPESSQAESQVTAGAIGTGAADEKAGSKKKHAVR